MTEPLPDNQLRAEIGKLMAETVRLAHEANTREPTWLPIAAVLVAAGGGAALVSLLSR